MTRGDTVRLLPCEDRQKDYFGATGKIIRMPLFDDGDAFVQLAERVVPWPLARLVMVGEG